MGLNVKITIKGLSLCYVKDHVWNIVMIGDPHHECKFFVDGTEHRLSPLRKLNKTRTITFGIGSTAPIDPVRGTDFDRIFNLAGDHAHGPDVLRVNPQGVTGKVHLKIPNATVSPGALNSRECYIQDASRPGSPVMIIEPVAKELIAELHLADKEQLTVIIEEPGESPVSIPLVGSTPVSLEVLFDNDCKGVCRGNDAIQLYHWVQAPDRREYYWGQVLPTGKFPSEEELQERDHKILIPDQGNCDPATSDPPPGP